MQICSPIDGKWHEVSGTTMASIATELELPRTNGWLFKVNGEVRKSLGTVTDTDTVEMVDISDSDTETVQSNTVSEPSGDNK